MPAIGAQDSYKDLGAPVGGAGFVSAPELPPNAPVGVRAVAAESSILVYFQYMPDTVFYQAVAPNGRQVTGTTSPLRVTNQLNGVPSTVTLYGINHRGVSPGTVSNVVTPTQLPAALRGQLGIQAWWQASSLVQAAASAVTTWTDSSGNGYSVTQGTAGNRPTYQTAVINGRPVVRFDGVDDFMQGALTSQITGPDVTWFFVYRSLAATNTNGFRDQYVVSNCKARNDMGFAFTTSDNFGGSGNSVHCLRGPSDLTPGSAIVVNTPYIISIVPGSQFFVNGTRQPTANAGWNPLILRTAPFAIGTLSGGDNNTACNMDLAEMLVVRGRLSDANRYVFEAYLAALYNITVVQQPAL